MVYIYSRICFIFFSILIILSTDTDTAICYFFSTVILVCTSIRYTVHIILYIAYI